MDLDIIKIASDTTNNKILKDYTHRSKYKNKTCGDIIEMRVNIKKNIIQDIGYQTKSCVYCQASASLISHKLIKKSKNKVNYLLKNLIDYFENQIKPLPKNLNKFNKLFDENMKNKPDPRKNEWFTSEKNEYEVNETVNSKNMGDVFNRIKDNQNSMIKYRGVETLCVNSNSGNRFYDDEEKEKAKPIFLDILKKELKLDI